MFEILENPIVRIPGVLRAANLIAGCTVETWKEQSFNGRIYTRCRIVEDPPQLADGPYTLRFAGYSIPTNKFEGKWEPVVLEEESQLQKAA